MDQFASYIKIIGAGKRASKPLTQQQAYDAFSLLLNGKASMAQIGAFLMLLRVKEESVDELCGFLNACRDTLAGSNNHDKTAPYTSPSLIAPQHQNQFDIDLPCYAGKRRQLPWYLLSYALLHQNNYSIFLHGTSEPQTTRLYIKEVLQSLGVLEHLAATSFEQANAKQKSNGVVYMDLCDIHPALYNIIQMREQFSLRSCANSLARMLNPLDAKLSVQGVHHKHIDDKHIAIASKLEYSNILCFRGESGEPEIDPSKDTNVHMYDLTLSPKSHTQISYAAKQSWQLKPKAFNIDDLRQVWQGEVTDSYAYNTVISTLSAVVQFLHQCSQEEATYQAQTWWEQRQTQLFFGCTLNKPS